jgi:hypothetical protein
MFMAMSVLCSLLLSATSAEATSVEPFARGFLKQESPAQIPESNEDDDQPHQVSIHSFRLLLEPTPAPLTSTDERELHIILQTFLSSYVKDELGSQGVLLDYLMLADVQVVDERQRRLQDDSNSSTLFVSAGVASFTSAAYPTESDLAALIAQGLESNLTGALATTDYAYVETVNYISLTVSPTSSPVAQEADEANVNDTGRNVIIAAGATGAFIGILIIAAALFVRHNRGPSLASHLERDYKDHETTLDSSIQGDDVNSLQTGSDGRTRDGSDAWTMPSSDEDANTVFSSWTVKSLLGLLKSSDIHRTESFERDRQVSLRKDMLDTSPAWNITDICQTDSGKTNDDTVLKPSHFGVEDEEARANAAKHKSEPCRFETNDEGEEIYLMPTKKRQSKVSFPS